MKWLKKHATIAQFAALLAFSVGVFEFARDIQQDLDEVRYSTNYLRILQIFSFKKHQRHRLAILLPIDAFGTNTFKALKAPQGPISAYQCQSDTTSPNSPLQRAPS